MDDNVGKSMRVVVTAKQRDKSGAMIGWVEHVFNCTDWSTENGSLTLHAMDYKHGGYKPIATYAPGEWRDCERANNEHCAQPTC